MAVLVSDHFFLLLPLVMLFASVTTSQFTPTPPVNVTVTIKSEMGDASRLNVHCRAYWGGPPIPIIDLGERKLVNDELYSFSFQRFMSSPQERRRVYMCECSAIGFPVHQFYVEHPYDLCKCVDGHCPLRIVKPKGFFCGEKQVDTWAESA